jgi:hypothetical protein
MLAGGALWLPESLSIDSQRSIDSQSELTVNLNIISIDSQSQKMGPRRERRGTAWVTLTRDVSLSTVCVET